MLFGSQVHQIQSMNENGPLTTSTGGAYNKGINVLYENQHTSDITNTTRSYSTLALQWNI